jgi:hypothetical protein
MSFSLSGIDRAIPSSDGEHVALQTAAPLELPGAPASANGARVVFSRTSSGWAMRSAITPDMATDRTATELLSPDLSQVAFFSQFELNELEAAQTKRLLEVGPIGGPYTTVANAPANLASVFVGANAGTTTVPSFTNVLFESEDHALPLAEERERELALQTVEGAYELYDWTGGHLRLINLQGEGSHAKLVNNCGARLGDGTPHQISRDSGGTTNAISENGVKIFFTTEQSGAGCEGPPRLFVRIDGRETIEVPAPPGERVDYNGATPDGSKVFFTAYHGGNKGTEQDDLYMYDTVTGALTHIDSELNPRAEPLHGVTRFVVIASGGSAVYYDKRVSGGFEIYRFDLASQGPPTFVAFTREARSSIEASYATPSGEDLVFAAREVIGQPRGAEHNELYRYDNASKTVLCVSCGEGVAPVGEVTQPPTNEMFEPNTLAVLNTDDETPEFLPMTDDGHRVFFETTAQLVPQDRNSTELEISNLHGGFPGMDVYEWEADGEGSCRTVGGCTFLISGGENTGPSLLLGASRDGRDIFFTSASKLVSQDVDELGDIYDAREGGGFPEPAEAVECVSCQGAGASSPLFGAPASATFSGAGNPVAAPVKPIVKPKSKPRPRPRCRRGYRRGRRGLCVRVVRRVRVH